MAAVALDNSIRCPVWVILDVNDKKNIDKTLLESFPGLGDGRKRPRRGWNYVNFVVE